MKGKLSGKTAIVTGAGSGIGQAIAILFASEGANVVVADLNEKNAQTTVDTITSNGGKALAVVVDVSKQDQIQNMVSVAKETFGTVDILINNAGIMDDFVPVAEVTNDLWERVMDVNLNGVMYACREVLTNMLESKKGVIVNVASVGGINGARAGAAYTASKHGVVGLTKNIAYMYAQHGIRCNAVAPGGVETHIGDNMKPNELGYQRMMTGAGTMVRMGKPEEIASVVLFLASEESSIVNGTVFAADAGWSSY